jgi:hypothetical protein
LVVFSLSSTGGEGWGEEELRRRVVRTFLFSGGKTGNIRLEVD